MRVIVLGSGIIGVTTAWQLAQAGAEVTVIDRQEHPAMETSFANAGQISPGYSTPWAAPGIPLKAAKWLFQKHAPLAIKPDGSWFQAAWMLKMLSQCNASAYATNKDRMVRLAEYALTVMKSMRAELPLQYDGRQLGTLQVFRKPAQLVAARRDIAVLEAAGVRHELLDTDGCVAAEPALARASHKLVGGLRLPGDETGDCQMFTTALAQNCRERGVKFLMKHDILDWIVGGVSGKEVQGVQIRSLAAGSRPQELRADAVVVAMGCYSRQFMAKLDVNLPVYPMKGYSLTIPIVDAARAPVSTVMDETYKIALTRFENRLRVGGMAELSGYDLSLNPRRKATLSMVASDLFDGASDLSRAEFWTGLRPMTPDGTPIVGPTAHRGVWLNTGHGTLGWTMACGSAKILSDQILGRTPEIRVDDLSVSRYHAKPKSVTGFNGLRPVHS